MSRWDRTPSTDEHPLGELYEWVRNLPPHATVHVRTRDSSSSSRLSWMSFLMGAAGAAAFSGVEHALRNRKSVRGAGQEVKDAAGRFGGWLRDWFVPVGDSRATGFGGTAAGHAAASSPPGASSRKWTPRFKTLDDLVAEWQRISKTPIGQLFIEWAKQASATLNPREIAERLLAKVRDLLGDSPLLHELERDPGAVFEAAADLLGLEGERRAQVKQALYAILGVTDETDLDPTPTAASYAGHTSANRSSRRTIRPYQMLIPARRRFAAVSCPEFAPIRWVKSQHLVSWSGSAAIRGDIIALSESLHTHDTYGSAQIVG